MRIADVKETGDLKAPENLAELFLLFSINSSSGKLHVDQSTVELGLAGAVLADLARRGQLTVTRDLVIPTPKAPNGQPVLERPLDKVLQIIERSPENQDAEQWINRLGRQPLFDAIVQRLVEKKMIEHQKKRVLGFIKIDRYIKQDMYVQIDLAAKLRTVLTGNLEMDLTTWPLLALLHMTRVLPKEFRGYKSEEVTEIIFGWQDLADKLLAESAATEQNERTKIGEETGPERAIKDLLRSVAEALQATENTIAESLTASRGGPSGMKN